MITNLFLVEGETEERLIKTYYIGQVKIVNLWSLPHKKINTITRLIPQKGIKVFIVCDIDNTVSCQNFLKNFHEIKRHVGVKNIYLLQQTKNFEHELLYCMGIKRKKLYEIFNNATSDEKLKRNFLSENDLLAKLKSNGFDIKKLWSREICQSLVELKDFQKSSNDIKGLIRGNI